MARALYFLLAIGLTVLCVSSAWAETKAVIANTGAGQVIRVLAGEESVEAADLSGNPFGVALTPDGRQALVTLEGDNQLAFVDVDTFPGNPFLLPVGRSPRGVAVEPAGVFAYVTNFEDATLSRIQVLTGTVVETIAVQDGPMGVVAWRNEPLDTPIVYVANQLDDSVSVIEGEERTTLTDVGDGPTGLAISPDGAFVYVANTNDDTVSIIDTAVNEVIETIFVGDAPWGVAIGGQGAYAYVTNNAEDTVTVIRTSDASIFRTLRVGDAPRGVAAARNANFAYVVTQGSGSIEQIDLDDETVTPIGDLSLTDAFSLGAFMGGRPPQPPGGVEAEAVSESSIDLRWQDNSDDEDGFKIERSKQDEERYTQIATVDRDTTSFQDNNLVSETRYFYRVRSFHETADSAFSASVSAETTPYTGSVWCFVRTVFDLQSHKEALTNR